MNEKFHRGRRAELARRMGAGIAVIATAPERVRNRDSLYPYRFDSTFYYLTGFPEPEAVLVLVVDGKKTRSLLFCRERDPERAVWDGFRHGPKAARRVFGFDEAHPIGHLDALLPPLLCGAKTLFVPFDAGAHQEKRVARWMKAARGLRAAEPPAEIRDLARLTDDMRTIKEAHELDCLSRAAEIAVAAHRRAMAATRPEKREYEIEAELLYEFRRRGAQAPAYPSIVAAGANACVLHYVENSARLQDGELLLIDAGCEVEGYASDITRTFPVNGRFGGAARDLYEVVLAAHAAALQKARPGARWDAMHEAAVKVLAQGLVELKLCKGPLDRVIERGDYRRFYMHRTGHLLGLDVHDAGCLRENGKWRKLAPGMVFTVEPGCYVRPADKVPRAFWNIGIRIEDDVAVTANGHAVLTEGAPRTVAEIEEWMRESR